MTKIAGLLFALLTWAGGPPCNFAGAQDYRAILADGGRPASERAMDDDRKPEQILKFFGVKSGDRTADLMAGAGYYTAILSQVVGASGVVYSANPSFSRQIQERFHSPRYANVKMLAGDMDKVALPSDHSLDFVLIHLDYHMVAAPARAVMNQRVYRGLRSGGVYGVIDHAGKEDSSLAAQRKLHRIASQVVIKEVSAAGFKQSPQSQLLRNPRDAHDQVSHSFEGNSDRFVLAFVKP